MSLRKQTPSDFLKQIIGRPVVVKLNSGVDYRGTAAAMMTEVFLFPDLQLEGRLIQTIVHVNAQVFWPAWTVT